MIRDLLKHRRRYLRAKSVEPSEAAKSRKQKRSLKQMHIDLCALGYQGSYDHVSAFARQWKLGQFEMVN